MFALFKNKENLKLLELFTFVPYISENEINNKSSFLEIQISQDKNQFNTTVYRKPHLVE